MKFRGCDEEGCSCLRKAFELLRHFGIEPSIDEDERSKFLEFRLPTYWSFKKRRRFSLTVNRCVMFPPWVRPCECCGNNLSTIRFCLCRGCQLHSLVCIECLDSDTPPQCIHCFDEKLVRGNVFSVPPTE